jgi:hypothetical protein
VDDASDSSTSSQKRAFGLRMKPPYDISPRRYGAHEECELTLSLVLWRGSSTRRVRGGGVGVDRANGRSVEALEALGNGQPRRSNA